MSAKSIRLVIDSRLDNIPLVGVAVNAIASLAPLSETERCQVELCAVEAVTNAVVHAYERRSGGTVEVDLELSPTRLTMQISDYGRAMPGLAPPLELDLDPNDRENLPEGGMGLYIIDNVMSEVSYRTARGRNTLVLVKHLPAGTDRAAAAG